jgi:hypothetical protein
MTNIDKNLESRFAEHYFAWADKENFIFNFFGTHFPRVYVSFTPTEKMCKLYNSCSPIPIAVHPFAAPAFQMVFEDLYTAIDSMKMPDGTPFVLEEGDLFSPLSSLHCLGDSPMGASATNVMASTKPDCLKSAGMGLYKKTCYEPGAHGAKCPHGIDYHSYGVGVYVKEGENPSVNKSEAASLMKAGDLHQFPEQFIAIFIRYGFQWGCDQKVLAYKDNASVHPARFTLSATPENVWEKASKGKKLPAWGSNRSMTQPATTIMQYCAKRFAKKEASAIFK